MNQSLHMLYLRLIDECDQPHHRYLYHEIDLNQRLIALVGARGVGKTTLLLQLIKNKLNINHTFYFSADHIYFSSHSIYDFVENLYLESKIDTIIIDEAHKYRNWCQEIKNLYDGFPKLKIIFSGSSSIDLIKGSFDLSRRALLYHLPGLSFREYLQFNNIAQNPAISFEALINDPTQFNQQIALIPQIQGHFKLYLEGGYYPLILEDPIHIYQRLLRIAEKTIYEDIANYYALKTQNLNHFKRILLFLASIEPGEVRVHTLARNLSIDDKTASNYLNQLQETGLIRFVYPAEPGNAGLRRPEKVFINNTCLQYALCNESTLATKLGSIRELFFLQSLDGAKLKARYSKIGDYEVHKSIFEIGGKNKARKQLQSQRDAFLVKDDISLATRREIPLYFFGFLY